MSYWQSSLRRMVEKDLSEELTFELRPKKMWTHQSWEGLCFPECMSPAHYPTLTLGIAYNLSVSLMPANDHQSISWMNEWMSQIMLAQNESQLSNLQQPHMKYSHQPKSGSTEVLIAVGRKEFHWFRWPGDTQVQREHGLSYFWSSHAWVTVTPSRHLAPGLK